MKAIGFEEFLRRAVLGENAEELVHLAGPRIADHWFDQCNGAVMLARQINREDLVERLAAASAAIDTHLTLAEA